MPGPRAERDRDAMEDNKKLAQQQRDNLISELSDNILKTAKTIVRPEDGDRKVGEIAAEIRQRLSFEANVLLNEAVTRLSPARLYKEITDAPQRTFQRFGKNFRFQHALMFISVIILIITGMPLKFPTLGISKFIVVDVFGGLENSTLIHRIGAVGLIVVGVWHLGYITISRFGRRDCLRPSRSGRPSYQFSSVHLRSGSIL